MMIFARIFAESIFGFRTRNVHELKIVSRCRTEKGALWEHYKACDDVRRIICLLCRSISGKDERSCGSRQEDKQKEK